MPGLVKGGADDLGGHVVASMSASQRCTSSPIDLASLSSPGHPSTVAAELPIVPWHHVAEFRAALINNHGRFARGRCAFFASRACLRGRRDRRLPAAARNNTLARLGDGLFLGNPIKSMVDISPLRGTR
jgi:hypothetical protein